MTITANGFMPNCTTLSDNHFAADLVVDGKMVTADVYHGDALEILPTLIPGSFQASISDIPYNEIDAHWDIAPFPIEEYLKLVDRCLSPTGAQIVVFCSSRQLARVENCLRSFRDENGDSKYRVLDGVWLKQNPFPLRPGVTNCKENVVIAYTRDCEHLQRKRLDAPFNAFTSSLVTPNEKVWKDDGNDENAHETQKPQELLTKVLRKIIAPGSNVLDGTAGVVSLGRACLANGYNSTSVEMNREFFERGCAAFSDPRIMKACFDRKKVGLDNLSLGHGILRKVDRILAGELYITDEKRKKIMDKISEIRGMGLVKSI